MTAEQMWAAFSARKEIRNASYEAWAFGGDPDGLAALVLAGTKTATASAYPLYEPEGESLPEAGEYSVILNSRNEAVCVVLTDRVTVLPYRDVGAEHARREGEGDRSLAYWRQLHGAFFQEELSAAGLTFAEDMPVVCEEFHVIWPERRPCDA